MRKLLVLHGALGASAQMEPLVNRLAVDFETSSLDFTGHGIAPYSGQPFSIELFAQDVIDWMDSMSIGQINIFGYSMGGYVGLYLCRHYPFRVNRLMTLGTKLNWSADSAQKEVKMLQPEIIVQKVPQLAEALKQRHRLDWKQMLSLTSDMMVAMGHLPPLSNQDFSDLGHDICMCVGDRDKMVSVEETLKTFRLLKAGSMSVLARTSHPVEQLNYSLIADEAHRFFYS